MWMKMIPTGTDGKMMNDDPSAPTLHLLEKSAPSSLRRSSEALRRLKHSYLQEQGRCSVDRNLSGRSVRSPLPQL